ncbi:MAG: putative addiction module antidote protein [Proteobacteria bacterium]|nr:putative addiction module antidote protein [Pseudomonadota bacterium]
MKTIFIGGSRDISRLPQELKERLDAVMAQGHRVILGDASGADKAVQKYLADHAYRNVTLFCSGDRPRNNVGNWMTRNVIVESKTKDYQFYAAKDREMAREADFGLMIWDGKSPGTLLNLLRLSQADKIAVLYNIPTKDVVNFKMADQIRRYIASCDAPVRADIEKRATPLEKMFLAGEAAQPSLLDEAPVSDTAPPKPLDARSIDALNKAFHTGNVARIIETLGALAREQGMSHVARETGLAREGLYRSLDSGGNPEFATVMKVLSSIGVTLDARPTDNEALDR